MKVFFIIFLLHYCRANSGEFEIKVGAIFFENETSLRDAFKSYINNFNVQYQNNQYNSRVKLIPIIRFAITNETSILQRITCELFEDGVAAIFGPTSKASYDIIASMCNNYGIPHLLYDWEEEDILYKRNLHNMTINVYPDASAISKMYAKILQYLIHKNLWETYTIIYDSQEGLNRLQDVLELKPLGPNMVSTKRIDTEPEPQESQEDANSDVHINKKYLKLWKDIKPSGEKRIIMDCSPNIVLDLLEAANEFNMTNREFNYLLTNPNMHSIDLTPLTSYEAVFHTIKFEDKIDHTALDPSINFQLESWRNNRISNITPPIIFLNDAVLLFGKTILTILSENKHLAPPRELRCWRNNRWRQGEMVKNEMIKYGNNLPTSEKEFTTNFRFEYRQFKRKHFVIEMSTQVASNETTKTFDTLDHSEVTRSRDVTIDSSEKFSSPRRLIVSTRVGEPYVIDRNTNGSMYTKNERYEGYAIDLIKRLANVLNFEFDVEVVEDKEYGSWDPNTKSWNGIIGQLISKKADMGICDLTITPERREVVDFTVPFMSLGISILYYNEPPEPPDLFSFLQPFALEVWMYMATAYLILSFLLYLISRISKNEWENPHPCNKAAEELENQWSLGNTMWLTMGSIMGQGCDILPRSGAMRLVTGMWWFFALMMLNSYTANLAAFLTSSRIPSAIEGIEDLAAQTRIKFGTVRSGSTRTFFKESNDSIFRQAYTKMEQATPSVYTSSNKEGLERVKKGKGKYAFLMETTSLQYLKERNCDVTQIGGQIGQKHYGIALPLGSPLRSKLSVSILKLSEEGELFRLKEKWWLTDEKCPTFEQDDSNELSIEQLGGVFLVLGCGTVLGYIVGIFEFIWNVQRVAVEERVTPFDAFRNEAMFAIKFWIKKKPIRIGSEEATPSSSESNSAASLKSGNTSSHNNNNQILITN